MSFVKFPKAVVDVVVSDASFPLYFRVFVYLASRCHYKTGVLHRLTASDVSSAVGCHRASVSRVVKKLRSLGWLIGGRGLSGQLAGFKSRPFRSASDVRSVNPAHKEVAPHSPSENGNRHRPVSVPEKSETKTFEEALVGWQSNIPKS